MMLRTLPSFRMAGPAVLLVVLSACQSPQAHDSSSGPLVGSLTRGPAVAQLVDAKGEVKGRAVLTESPGGLDIAISVSGLQPGLHGFHIHEKGVCGPGPDAATGKTVAFGAAGGHFDPGQSRNHGRPGQRLQEAHAGELPNIEVGADGNGSLRYLNPNVSLSREPSSVFGRSLVVHDQPDDYVTDPAGGSGPSLLCGVIRADRPSSSISGRTTIEGAAVYPEGIAVDTRTGNAYVGSTRDGSIWRLRRGADKAELLQAGGAVGRQGAFGMKVDAAGRLWVAGGPQGNVAVLDVATGISVANLDAPKGAHVFLNDLVIAPDNRVYVTDSFRPMLYRAPLALDGGTALEPWLDLSATPIKYQANQINLNGIVASPDGRWLMAVQLVTGQLWRIGLADGTVTEVAVQGGDLRHGDGLALRAANELYVVRNQDNEVARLELSSDWSQGRVTRRWNEPDFNFPTTAAMGPSGLMVVNAQLNKMKQPPPLLPFDVVTLNVAP